MIKYELNANWQMHRADRGPWYPAAVPGSVYGDLMNAGVMDDPFRGDNEDRALALMDEDYEYVCTFRTEQEWEDEDYAVLRFEGIDTVADIVFNGEVLDSVKNMHRVYEYDIKELLAPAGMDNELKIYFYSPNRYIQEAYEESPTEGSGDAMPGFVHLRKAHCMFGWDWGAHLPDAGIWRPVYLLAYSACRIKDVFVRQQHLDGEVQLSLAVGVECESPAAAEHIHTHVEITDPDGRTGCMPVDHDEDIIAIENPKLWWPRGYGEQPLYTVTVWLADDDDTELDCSVTRIGLRTLTVDTSPDEYGNEFAFAVNGVKIFAMGADYIPEDHLLGRITPDTTRQLLMRAARANYNCIRVWGGGYYPDDWFYDACDELGLIVWQDFMFACASYDLTEDFEEEIEEEFSDNIIRLRNHASLGLLCGNNECETFTKSREWTSKQSEVHDYIVIFERILPKMVKMLAPQTFYWPSSPSSGGTFDDPDSECRGDRHYWGVWHGNEPFCAYREHTPRFMSEFGFQSFPALSTIKERITDNPSDLNIFSEVMERHQRNGAANGKIMNYMQQMYRYPTSFDMLIYASQLLQAEAVQMCIEHLRRHRGQCMGVIVWQLNDCWPVASWSSIDYTGRLKALHYYEKRAFSPILISCETQGFMESRKTINKYPADYEKSMRLAVTNETTEPQVVTLSWEIRDALGKAKGSHVESFTVPAQSVHWLDKADLSYLREKDEYISYSASVNGEVVSRGTSILSVPKYFHYADPKLEASVSGDEITVTARAYAHAVEIQNETEDLVLSDNYFDMNAGTVTVKVLEGKTEGIRLRSVYDIN